MEESKQSKKVTDDLQFHMKHVADLNYFNSTTDSAIWQGDNNYPENSDCIITDECANELNEKLQERQKRKILKAEIREKYHHRRRI
jgi:hypothetical protein